MFGEDLEVGLVVYVIVPSIVGFSDLKRVIITKVYLEKRFIEYSEFNDIANRNLTLRCDFENIAVISEDNRWLFAKAKTLKIQFDTVIDSNLQVMSNLEKIKPDFSPQVNFKQLKNKQLLRTYRLSQKNKKK